MSDELILEARHITKKFPADKRRELVACDNINLSVYKGKTLGIVGESGCGKSTFVKMIAQILEPTNGEIIYRGQNIFKLKGEALRQNRKNIQMVFQDPALALNPKMQIIDIITEPLFNFKMIKREEKAERAKKLLEMVELSEEFLYRYPHGMSGGQRQRVGIARALALEPEILVCDEATSALDVSVQDKIIELLVKLQREKGISIIFICHDVALVQSFSHETVVMYLGNVMEIIPEGKIKEKAAHPYTRALLTSIFSINMDFEQEITCLNKDVPSPLDVPKGCPFQNRCSKCDKLCKSQKPDLKKFEDGHFIACHFPGN